jgi:hypothetical protein
VRFTLETVPVTLSDKLMEALGGRGWTRRKGQRAMFRLRDIFEGGEDARAEADRVSRRVTVAGG